MLIILSLFAAFFIGFPICFALGLVSLAQLYADGMSLLVIIQRLFSGGDSIALIAIPLFMLSGELMFRGGMSKRLVDFADTLLGHFPSGLAMVSILACMFFAAITGSAIAATAAIGGIMIPLMKEKGYENTFSAPLLACGGSIGPIIPPSIPLLVYGTLANVSVGSLFIGGFVPGLLMGIGLMIFCFFIGRKRHYKGREQASPFKSVLKSGKDALLALFMPVIIIGGIMSGVFTPTESGAIAVFYALIVGIFIYRELSPGILWEAFVNSAKATGQVLIVVACASLFTWVITVNQIPQSVSAYMSNAISNKIVLLLVINIVLLIAGTFIDTTSAIVIFAPLFIPIVTAMGVDLIHFGLIVAVNLTIGMCTPPLGVCLFVSGSIAKISLKEQMRDLLPMLLVLLTVLLLVTYVPQLTLFLPGLFSK
jgi:C4-dicarboxylate transporter DctM subunit